VAEALAARLSAPVVISADALQVYEGLTVLTGAEPRHRLVGVVPVTHTFSAGEFAAMAHAEIDTALARGRTPIVVGGTGLYLRAALTDLDLRPPPPPELRAAIEVELRELGPETMHARLAERAPWAAAQIEPTDRTRIIRSLELLAMGELAEREGESQLWTAETRHPTELAGLVMDRDELYARIDARVDAMIAAGAREEVERAVAAGASATARKALGFEELLRGDVEGMKRRTRQYAKRQLTWMRKLAGVRPIDVTGRPPEWVAREIAARGPAPG
jgi:tRNA dimethylallyltransferase